MSEKELITPDLAVIGAGAAGLSAAAGAAMLGLKVVLFEEAQMGGDCLNTGCVPSKALLAAAKRAHAMRSAGEAGLAPVEPVIDWPAVRARVKAVIAAIAPVDSQERFEGLGVRVVREHARFIDPRTLQSDSLRVRARRFVIATGGKPAVPPIPGLAEAPYLTNETVFDLESLPRRLIVLGAGPMGVELAQAFRRLGSEVALVEAALPLARLDSEAAGLALAALEREGVELYLQARAGKVEPVGEGVRVTLETKDGARAIEGSRLLLALGRRANVEGLGLEAAGVAFDARGVQADAGLRTANPRIWVIGDAAGRGQLTHLAGWHASVFARRALFKVPVRADAAPIPEVVYGDPELAQLGLTEAQARAAGGAIRVVRAGFDHNDRAIAEGRPDGFAKLITDKAGVILGATIAGEGAGEAIQLVALAMANKLKVRALANLVAPYPTRGEIVRKLASEWHYPLVFGAGARRLVGLLQRVL